MHIKVLGLINDISLIIAAVAISLMFQLPVYAQTDRGRMVGTVTDANGAVVPGASVVVKNEHTGEQRTATTNESGYYVVAALKPAVYSVTVDAQNMAAEI